MMTDPTNDDIASSEEPPEQEPQESTPRTNDEDDRIAKLSRLAELRDTGVLTEEEFQAEKARILRS
jgi:hypothetical protein